MVPLIEARGLAVARAGIAVLEGVDLVLGAGQALILRGPNGIGKTTLLRVLARLQPAMAGEVLTLDEGVVYAGHADGIKASLTLRENLGFWARVFGSGAEAEARALAAMGLGALADRPAAQLSAGQKRRLGLARLLVAGRRVWLLDEPTVSLDAAASALFADMVRGHLAQGGAAVLATHIDLGLGDARVLDLTPFKARSPAAGGPAQAFEEAFL